MTGKERDDLLRRGVAALEHIAVSLMQWQPVESQPERCEHPAEKVEDFSTMGQTRWRCQCGASEGMEGIKA